MKLDFPANLYKFYITKFDLKEKFAWYDPFWAFLLSKFRGKGENLQFFSINLQDPLKKTNKLLFRNGETRFQNAETRFENAETPQSRNLFARTWMDFAQKKPAK